MGELRIYTYTPTRNRIQTDTLRWSTGNGKTQHIRHTAAVCFPTNIRRQWRIHGIRATGETFAAGEKISFLQPFIQTFRKAPSTTNILLQ